MIRKRKPVDDVPLNSLWVANHRGKAFHVRVISSRSRSGVTLYKVANAYTNIPLKNEKMRSFLVRKIMTIPSKADVTQKIMPELTGKSLAYPCADFQDEKFTQSKVRPVSITHDEILVDGPIDMSIDEEE